MQQNHSLILTRKPILIDLRFTQPSALSLLLYKLEKPLPLLLKITHRLLEVERNDPGPEGDLGEAAELPHVGGHVLRDVLRDVPQRRHLVDEAADAALGAAAAHVAAEPRPVMTMGRQPEVVQLLGVQLKRQVERCLSPVQETHERQNKWAKAL